MNTDTMITGLMARPWIRGHEMRRAITSLAEALADRTRKGSRKITVEWVPMATAAINSSGVLYLASVADDAKITRATFVRYVGFVIHEILHWVYTDFTVDHSNQYIRTLHNAVEDVWIERRGIQSGLTGNIERVLTALIGQIVDESLASVTDWTNPAQYPFALAVWGRRYAKKVPLAQGLEPIFNEASTRIDACTCSADTLEVALWVMSQLQQITPPEQNKQPDQQSDSSDQPDQPGQSGPAKPATGNEKPAPVEPNIPADPSISGPGWDCSRVKDKAIHVAGSPQRAISHAVPARLRYEVRRLFDNSGLTLFTQGRRSGSVHVGSLHKATITDRVFQRRQDVEGVDSAVMIAMDCSGSMSGNRIRVACDVAAALVDALASAEVEVGLLSFTGRVSIPAPIGTSPAKIRNLLSRLDADGGTAEDAAVRVGVDTLLARNEARRVLFILTDGVGAAAETARQLSKSAQNLGITVVGVGILADVADVYPQSVNVYNLSDLGNAVFSQIKLAA